VSKLRERLGEEDTVVFEQLLEEHTGCEVAAELDWFREGFLAGARLMTEIFYGEKEALPE